MLDLIILISPPLQTYININTIYIFMYLKIIFFNKNQKNGLTP